jgi:hypothetical protein
MFCPKCATENPDNSKFCRSCRANLSNVLLAVEGEIVEKDIEIQNSKYSDLYSSGVRNVILGFGFFLTTVFVKSMPGDTYFWLLFLIPAFCLLASGVSRILQAENVKKEKPTIIYPPTLSANQANTALPPIHTEYVSPISKFETNDLVPTSVTEETTQHLKISK